MKVMYTVSMILFLGIFLFSVTAIVCYFKDAGENKRETEKVIGEVMVEPQESHKEEAQGEQINFKKLKELNADAVGWIMFYEPYVNYPLVQGDDNSYYLNHSFYRKENAAGCIFMDCRNQSLEDKNVVIYGHNMVDDTMFGSLKDVFKEDFWEQEGRDIILIADTDNHIRKYQIFSYYIVEDEDYYITTAFSDDGDFTEFLDVITSRSFKETDVTVTAEDHILTLSTCAGTAGMGKRRVIHGKLIENVWY